MRRKGAPATSRTGATAIAPTVTANLTAWILTTFSVRIAPAWLLAEAGDAEAMYSLTRVHHDRAVNATPHGKAPSLKAAFWCRRAESSTRWSSDAEHWYRRATHGARRHRSVRL